MLKREGQVAYWLLQTDHVDTAWYKCESSSVSLTDKRTKLYSYSNIKTIQMGMYHVEYVSMYRLKVKVHSKNNLLSMEADKSDKPIKKSLSKIG